MIDYKIFDTVSDKYFRMNYANVLYINEMIEQREYLLNNIPELVDIFNIKNT